MSSEDGPRIERYLGDLIGVVTARIQISSLRYIYICVLFRHSFARGGGLVGDLSAEVFVTPSNRARAKANIFLVLMLALHKT